LALARIPFQRLGVGTNERGILRRIEPVAGNQDFGRRHRGGDRFRPADAMQLRSGESRQGRFQFVIAMTEFQQHDMHGLPFDRGDRRSYRPALHKGRPGEKAAATCRGVEKARFWAVFQN
jgi:hypothetical protein